MVSTKRQLTATKMSTTDCRDREMQRLGSVPQTTQQVYPTPSHRLSAELATAQEHHQQQYVRALRAKAKRVAVLENACGGDLSSVRAFGAVI